MLGILDIISNLNVYQTYALVFLLGSLTVASISDLKKLLAQKEFFQFWSLFTATLFAIELYPILQEPGLHLLPLEQSFLVKWTLIAAICVLSWKETGILFKLNKMDVVALAAIFSIFNPYTILMIAIITKLLSLMLIPLLSRRGRYPFLPIATLAALIILGLNVVLF